MTCRDRGRVDEVWGPLALSCCPTRQMAGDSCGALSCSPTRRYPDSFGPFHNILTPHYRPQYAPDPIQATTLSCSPNDAPLVILHNSGFTWSLALFIGLSTHELTSYTILNVWDPLHYSLSMPSYMNWLPCFRHLSIAS